jgi:hypothetical protein
VNELHSSCDHILIVDCFVYFLMSIININDQRMLIRIVDSINLC